MIVQEIMNKNVVTIDKKSTVKEAGSILNKNRISCLIVVDNGKMKGIITERDVLVAIDEDKNLNKVAVGSIMTKDVYFVGPNTDITDAAELMVKNKIKKLPVIYNGMLVGIVTATDLVAAEPKLMEQISNIMLLGKKQSMAG